jgi:hypothetical protein
MQFLRSGKHSLLITGDFTSLRFPFAFSGHFECNRDLTPTTPYDSAMGIQANDILLNRNTIESSECNWLIEVQSVSETEGTHCLLIKAILERAVDAHGERIESRRIAIVLPSKLNTGSAVDSVLFQIRRYIEGHDSDGVLDLSGNVSPCRPASPNE